MPSNSTRKLLFVSKGYESPSTRYRALQFYPSCRSAGFVPVHVVASGGIGAFLHTLRQASLADIVVVLRKTFPAPFLWLLRKYARRLVFDFDDAILCNSDGSPSNTRLNRFAAMVSCCDHVFAGNGFLAEQAARYNHAVTIVPTCIDVGRYANNFPKPSDSFDLVWIGSRSTRKYLVEVLPALRHAAAHIPGLRLKIVADFDLPDAGFPTVAIPWSADTEARELGAAHLGIAPMHDDNWSRGKCALKVLQYMAAGLPVISSDVGANSEVILDGETGFLVRDTPGWAERISLLKRDAELRERFGAAGRRRVFDTYSIEPVFNRIAAVLAARP